jgi:hypothetical protein
MNGPVYDRGGPTLVPRLFEVRIDRTTGLVLARRGVSVSTRIGTGFTFHFPPEFDDRAEYEMELKGYLNGGQVELADGRRYPIFFFDPCGCRKNRRARLPRAMALSPNRAWW